MHKIPSFFSHIYLPDNKDVITMVICICLLPVLQILYNKDKLKHSVTQTKASVVFTSCPTKKAYWIPTRTK